MNARWSRCCATLFGAAVLGILGSPLIQAQGFIVDRRPTVPVARSFEIREVSVDARVQDQVAEVQIAQTFHNPSSVQVESEFLFPLPEEGAVQNFVLLVDGKELPGRLMNKDEARRIYEEIVRSKRDPALLEYMGRGLYRTSVFPIPPGADRKVTMRYTQLCKRDRELVEFSYPLNTQKFTSRPIQRLAVNVLIRSKDAIKSVYCPSDESRIDRAGDHEARISLERRDVVPTRDFRLVYTMASGPIGATVLSYRPSASDDGYFLLLASPEVKPAETRPMPKTVIFVIDRSGSMAGKKIEQARNALKSMLNNLRDDDLFNIVVYDDRVESFRPELERYSSRSREEAERFVANIREGGSTNIDGALKTALEMIRDDSRPSYVLFMTDGLPTSGETQEFKIADNCRQSNPRRARVFCFGVGFDVNARLLDRLSGGNSGTSEYVKPDEDIETHVSRFYSRLTSPVLSDLKIELAGTDLNRTYPRDLPDLFEGGQLVWVGRYRQSGRTNVRLSGKVGSDRRTMEFAAELADAGSGTSHDFVERIWAMRRVGDLIDQIDLKGQNRELIDELVSLSTRYGIMTPYTSFLSDETVPLHAALQNSARASVSLKGLSQTHGGFAIAQRELKQAYMRADSFSAETKFNAPMAGSGQGGQGGMAGEGMGMAGMMLPRLSEAQARAAAPANAPAGVYRSLGTRGRLGESLDGEAGPAEKAKRAEVTVRQIGSKTFFKKAKGWIDSAITPEEEAKARVVRQFSEEFFELIRSQPVSLNQYLAFSEPVMIKLGDQVYQIETNSPTQ